MKDTETKNDTPPLHIIVLQNTVYEPCGVSVSVHSRRYHAKCTPRYHIHAVWVAPQNTRTAMCVKECSDIMQ